MSVSQQTALGGYAQSMGRELTPAEVEAWQKQQTGAQAGIFQKWGVEQQAAPPLTPQGDYMGQYGLTPEQIQANLDQQKVVIKQKYDLMRQDVEKQTENERQAQLAGLYRTGYVSPESSGIVSIGTASQETLNKRKDAIAAQEAG